MAALIPRLANSQEIVNPDFAQFPQLGTFLENIGAQLANSMGEVQKKVSRLEKENEFLRGGVERLTQILDRNRDDFERRLLLQTERITGLEKRLFSEQKMGESLKAEKDLFQVKLYRSQLEKQAVEIKCNQTEKALEEERKKRAILNETLISCQTQMNDISHLKESEKAAQAALANQKQLVADERRWGELFQDYFRQIEQWRESVKICKNMFGKVLSFFSQEARGEQESALQKVRLARESLLDIERDLITLAGRLNKKEILQDLPPVPREIKNLKDALFYSDEEVIAGSQVR